jgi:hypothetical protein
MRLPRDCCALSELNKNGEEIRILVALPQAVLFRAISPKKYN